VLAAGEMTGPEQATLFGRIVPKIRYYVAELPSGAFVVRVSKDGTCEVLRHESRARHRRRSR
jgi:hypothetical protein